jgi:hypothetical protein
MVPCEVRSLLDDFACYWETASGLAPARRERAWADLYESRHPDVFGHYFETWGSREELLRPALGDHEGDALLQRGAQLRAVLEQSAAQACEVLGVRDVPLRFVVRVGLFRADGWTDMLDGKDTVFFCGPTGYAVGATSPNGSDTSSATRWCGRYRGATR